MGLIIGSHFQRSCLKLAKVLRDKVIQLEKATVPSHSNEHRP